MDLYMEQAKARLDEISRLIFDIEDGVNSTEPYDYKSQAQQHLQSAREALRKSIDCMEWYIRKVG